MKNLLALVAIVLAFTVGNATAQTTPNETPTKATTEQAVSTDANTVAPAKKACCASHGAKAETAVDGEVKTASTTHEHAGAMCDPKNCTEAQKKQCSGAKASGKGCCMGAAAKSESKDEPKP